MDPEEKKGEEMLCDSCVLAKGYTHRSVYVTQQKGICSHCFREEFLTPLHALKKLDKTKQSKLF